MAQPQNIARFFFYLNRLNAKKSLSYSVLQEVSPGSDLEFSLIRKRQFYDDMNYLQRMIPYLFPQATLEKAQDGSYVLSYSTGNRKLNELEFFPFLKALTNTTNLFPYVEKSWMEKLSLSYGNPQLNFLDGRILYRSTPRPEKLNADHFHTLVRSLIEKKRVRLNYKNREGRESEVDFEPMLFLNHNGSWYLVGDASFEHRPDSDQPTELKMFRIKTCRLGNEPFRERFKPEVEIKRLETTYGSNLIMTEKKPISVKIRFYEKSVVHIDESFFHMGAVGKKNPDGSYDLTIHVNDLLDAYQLLGQWGDLARPLEPAEFVQGWKERVRRLALWAEQE
jgi:predicted DNA-binding transcriptional regulator YafY